MAHGWSSPTLRRSASITGRLPISKSCYSIPLRRQREYGRAPWEYTIGELFSDAGYATAVHGKWHMGEVEDRLPIAEYLS
jgi:arylsulfatase A-like enzyme